MIDRKRLTQQWSQRRAAWLLIVLLCTSSLVAAHLVFVRRFATCRYRIRVLIDRRTFTTVVRRAIGTWHRILPFAPIHVSKSATAASILWVTPQTSRFAFRLSRSIAGMKHGSFFTSDFLRYRTSGQATALHDATSEVSRERPAVLLRGWDPCRRPRSLCWWYWHYRFRYRPQWIFNRLPRERLVGLWHGTHDWNSRFCASHVRRSRWTFGTFVASDTNRLTIRSSWPLVIDTTELSMSLPACYAATDALGRGSFSFS